MARSYKYQWHGEPVKTEFGYCRVTENKEKPLYWYNYECLWDDYHQKERRSALEKFAHVPAIRVTSEGHSFCIANHHGIGVHKLINGGWPSHRHMSLPVEGFVPESELPVDERILYAIRKFDLEAFEQYESERRKWQKRNYPEEFARMDELRKAGGRAFSVK